jgi:hypothetical protein
MGTTVTLMESGLVIMEQVAAVGHISGLRSLSPNLRHAGRAPAGRHDPIFLFS